MPKLFRAHPPLIACAALMVALAGICVGGLVADDRMLVGAPIWLKPLKFTISVAVYATTLTLLISLLRHRRRLGWWLGAVVAVSMALEMVAIVTQVVRGRQSHFNVATPLDAGLFAAMGATIMVVWLATAWLGILLLIERVAERPLAVAVRLGLAVALAGMGVGFLMTGPTAAQVDAMRDAAPTLVGAHSVGVPDGGPGLPLIGWSTTGGDLRIGHFVGMHALQALPLLAFALTAAGRRYRRLRAERVCTRLIGVVAGGYAGVTALVTWQALRGQPLIHPDGLTLAALGGIVAAVALGVAWALASRADAPAPTAGPPMVEPIAEHPERVAVPA
ncbi:hypothetical protein [Rhizomonospora bruguierae]|uniref:hypothetical protein n=1 Tax=Rhizomonospora bruguierae TaxID=1581705 RepID=UPI001BCAEDA5|nr:hypothetical protein [Micromonospora sp. NBRC 107566]